ncbi:reverse transcriptase domain-containing protein [Tanacetum coccineum]
MSAMANTTPIVTTVTKAATKEKTPKEADATPRINILDFCEEHYEDILPAIMDKIFHASKKKQSAFERLSDTYSPSTTKSGPDMANSKDHSHSRDHPHRWDSSPSRDRPRSRDRSRGIKESYGNTCFSYKTGARHRYHSRDRDRSRSMKRGRESESLLSHVSESSTSDRGSWKLKSKRRKPTDKEDLVVPWSCEEVDPFTPRIRNFKSLRKTRMPNNVKTYDGTGDPEDHGKIFQAAAQQNKYVKDPVEIHNIKQMDGETMEDFMERFKVETGRIKGALECMRISGFMHGVNNPELTKCLNEHVPKTMEEIMTFIRGETAAAFKKKGHTSWKPLDQPKRHVSEQKYDFRVGGRRSTCYRSGNWRAHDPPYVCRRGSSTEVLYEHCFNWLQPEIKSQMVPETTSLTGFSGETIWPLGQLRLLVTIGDAEHSIKAWMNFMIVRSLSPYNGIFTIRSTILIPTECTTVTTSSKEILKEAEVCHKNFKVALHPNFPDQEVAIGGTLSAKGRTELCSLLKEKLDIFAWQPSDMTGVPRSVAEHRLNIREGYSHVRQKKRGQAPEHAKAIQAEVQKLVEAGIMREVYYHDWLSNPVMVKKHDGSWRMYVYFTDLNKVCPQDCYPLPEIDWKVESLYGYPFKCFLDAYKGYHQIQMTKSDEEKTAFHTSHGVYCYTKMPFGLKNAGTTYQRLVDKAFNNQVGRNIEVYIDDLVIKSHTETEMLRDMDETFRTLRKINMISSAKKCTFGAVEGKFLGYMISPEGIKLFLDKTEAITLKSAGRKFLALFKTLKKCIKKSDFYWTPEAEQAFKQLKQHYPEGTEFTYTLWFRFTASNNEAEYEALMAGLLIATQMGVRNMHVSIDSMLVANQVLGTYVAKEENMIKYLEKTKILVSGFANFSISQVPRSKNKKVDALSKIVSTSFAHLSKQVLVEGLKEKSIQEREVATVVEEDGLTWMTPIMEYLKDGTLPYDRKEASKLCIKARQYELLEGVLYRRSFLKLWLSMHARPWSVVAKAMRLGYYWPTMHRDARDMIRKYKDCQIHCPVPRNPQQPLTPITAPWTFYKWGIDIAGPFLEGPGKVKFLIVAMDYFMKWIEAKSVATISDSQVKKFVWDNIVCRFGLPREIVSDNEDVIPAEVGMPTYRTAVMDVVHNDEELQLNLDLLEERRERVTIHKAKAKLKMTKYYNARVRGVTFRPGDFVYRSNDASHVVDGGKLSPKWEGPYEVTEALRDGAYMLRSMDGTVLPRT